MKKIFAVCLLLLLFCSFTLVGCQEELSYNESKFVGNWGLQDIVVYGEIPGGTLKYPSKNQTFNGLYKRLVGKTEIVLTNKKKDGYILGKFNIEEEQIDFQWKVGDDSRKIELKNSLEILSLERYNKNELSTGYFHSITVIDDKMAILVNQVVMYTFSKTA